MRHLIILLSIHFASFGQIATKMVGGPCDGCDAMLEGMPSHPSWKTVMASSDEPGERLVISGTIYMKDGKTPAPGVILYVYHTDNKGYYSPGPNQTSAKRHGHLRGWMKTDDRGRFEFNTIRPAGYPNGKAPQHIHPLIKESGKSLYWIDEFLFDDDKLLTKEERQRQEKRGGSGIIHLEKKNGIWEGRRDIILGMNIPNY